MSDRRHFLQQSGACIAAAATRRVAHAALAAGEPRTAIAHTTAGDVRGTIAGGVNVFKGVRYGADTDRPRFMPPLPPARWTTVRDATSYGPACLQSGTLKEPASEDCLFLNVWTPACATAARGRFFSTSMGAPTRTAPARALSTMGRGSASAAMSSS